MTKYSETDILQLSDYKQSLINNYINKFIETRWRENDIVDKNDWLQFVIVQEYIKMVINLTETVKDIIDIKSMGGGKNENDTKL